MVKRIVNPDNNYWSEVDNQINFYLVPRFSIKIILQQATFNRPIIEHDATGGFQADLFGEGKVAGKHPGGPAFPVLFEGVADFAVEGSKLFFVAEAFTIRWVADQCAL